MPQAVGHTFTQQKPKRKYDFSDLGGTDLTDGQVWRLDRGRDYECSEANLRGHIRRFADEEGFAFGFQVLRNDKGPIGVELAFVRPGQSLPQGLPRSDEQTGGNDAGDPPAGE